MFLYLEFVFSCLYIALLGGKLFFAKKYAARWLRDYSSPAPWLDRKVTIAQPILAGDPKLTEQLLNNLRDLQEDACLVWLFDHSDKLAIKVMEEIDRSGVEQNRLTVVWCSDAPSDINPKAYKLQMALDVCTTPYFAVLDDDTYLPPPSVPLAIAELQRADLVTGLPSYLPATDFWSDAVVQFVNTNTVLTYLAAAHWFPPVSINGMFYMTRTQALRDLGGFQAIQAQLCDDYAVRQLYASNGKRIRQSILPLKLTTSIPSCGDFIRIMHRWNLFAWLLTKEQPFRVALYMTLFLGLPPILLWLIGITGVISAIRYPTMACCLTIAVIAVRGWILHSAYKIAFTSRSGIRIFKSIAVELSLPLFWMAAVLYPVIRWRGRQIRLLSRERGQRFVVTGRE